MEIDPKKIAIYLTNKCNLKCKHCFIEGSPQNDDFLSWSQIKTALNYFHPKGYQHVEFTGGESCISPYLSPAVKHAKKLGYTVGINSNGISPLNFKLFTPKLVDKFIFSLDGYKAATNDKLRGKGSHSACLKSIKKSLELGFRTEVIFTVNKYNLSEIPDIIRYLDKLNISRLSFNFISNVGTANFNQDFLLPPKKWMDAVKLIEIEKEKVSNLSLRYPPLFVNKDKFESIKKSCSYFCRLLDPNKVELYPDGNIYHCCLVANNKELSAGKVYDNQVIVDTTSERKFANKYKNLSCPAIQAKGSLYPNDPKLVPLCLYYKIISKKTS